ncbi:hypothetical protein F2Q70_00038084 [Brassica cretica]|uniref:Uncharacterized protein n=1 Tax=Brassica cretica TaxID=69181 RepID=A0A8S9K1K8_BRACR|nr:hypothetical protein F2Q70_00038084 [Brassica cretica]
MANSKLTNQTESKFKIYKVKKRKKRFAYPKLSPPQLRLISPLQLLVSSAASSRLFVPSSDWRFQPGENFPEREREREREKHSDLSNAYAYQQETPLPDPN